MSDDEWESVESAYPGPTPISVYATPREREEFGPPKNNRRMGKTDDEDWQVLV